MTSSALSVLALPELDCRRVDMPRATVVSCGLRLGSDDSGPWSPVATPSEQRMGSVDGHAIRGLPYGHVPPVVPVHRVLYWGALSDLFSRAGATSAGSEARPCIRPGSRWVRCGAPSRCAAALAADHAVRGADLGGLVRRVDASGALRGDDGEIDAGGFARASGRCDLGEVGGARRRQRGAVLGAAPSEEAPAGATRSLARSRRPAATRRVTLAGR